MADSVGQNNNKIILPTNIKMETDGNGTLYYIEYTYSSPKTIDRILDQDDIERGNIILSQAQKYYNFNDKVNDDDLAELKKLEEQLQPEYPTKSYFVEYCFSLLEEPIAQALSTIMPILAQ